MSVGGSSSARQFLVQKDTGDMWTMTFGRSGVAWDPVDRSFGSSEAGPSPRLPSIGVGGPIEAVAMVAQAAGTLGLWWETRQQRLLDEATREELRRIPWLADMIARWSVAHRAGNQLDLRVSEYLAREARATMDSLVANKRVSAPQSVLYELDIVRDTFRGFRELFLVQFEQAAQSSEIDLQGAVRRAVPGAKLDMDFVRRLGLDPAIEWSEHVRAKGNQGFDADLADALRHSSVFISRLFPSTELAIHEPIAAQQPGVIQRLVGAIAGALPMPRSEDHRPDVGERRDAFREFLLLPAEVARVKALHAAWLATSAVVGETHGAPLAVTVDASGVQVGLGSLDPMPQLGHSPATDLSDRQLGAVEQ